VRQRGVVLRVFVDFVGLLFVFFVTRNTEVGRDDVGFLISAISAVINEFSLFRHFHVVEVVAFPAEVHSLRYPNIVYSLSILI
jgi:ABC-type ATPase involved in cell division